MASRKVVDKLELEFRERVITTLTKLETQMDTLIGDGQPGRISAIESDLSGLKAAKNRERGAFAVISFVMSAVVGFLVRLLWR